MNVAFTALLILVLVLPGITLRYAYARGPWRWSHPTSLRPVADEVAYSIVFAIARHLLWLRLAGAFGHSPDLRSVLVLMSGAYGPDDAFLDPALSAITDHPPRITGYFASLYAFSAAAGLGAHWLVRRTGLDRATRLLRFNNDWYYLLSGEVLQFRELGIAGGFASGPGGGRSGRRVRGRAGERTFGAGGGALRACGGQTNPAQVTVRIRCCRVDCRMHDEVGTPGALPPMRAGLTRVCDTNSASVVYERDVCRVCFCACAPADPSGRRRRARTFGGARTMDLCDATVAGLE